METAAIASDDPRLSAFAMDLERLRQTLPARYSAGMAVGSDGARYFSCDGGAVIAACVAGRHGLQATVQVGLYWHSDARLVAGLRGDELEALAVTADEYAASWGLDEHHHWLEIVVGDTTYVYDPNGPARNEPYFQALTGQVRKRYAPLPDSDPWSHPVYDRHDDPLSVISALYPDAVSSLYSLERTGAPSSFPAGQLQFLSRPAAVSVTGRHRGTQRPLPRPHSR